MRFGLYLATSLFCILPALAHGQNVFVETDITAEQCLPIGTIIDLSKQNSPEVNICLLYTSPSPRDLSTSRMPSSA